MRAKEDELKRAGVGETQSRAAKEIQTANDARDRAEQRAAGTLVYVAPSGRAQARHPLSELQSTFDDANVSGFAVVSGDWKGIVPHCAGSDRKPSAADLPSMRVFHLPSDWAETSDLARTARGRRQAQRLLGLVLDAKLSCGCYQC